MVPHYNVMNWLQIMTDDSSLQRDELAALSAIFGDDWVCEDAENRVYSIELKTDSSKDGDWDKFIRLEFKLPSEYPSKTPATYEISAPWMSRKQKGQIKSSFDQIHEENEGESILYLWIEKAKEYLFKETEFQESETELESGENEFEEGEKCSDGKRGQPEAEVAIEIIHGEAVTDRKSAFQAHVAQVDCIEEVKEVVETLKSNKKIATAAHNIVAYRIVRSNSVLQDCDDDGETHAGSRLLHLLQILDAKNVVVVVSRWFGGIQLGPDRFKHINNVARDTLDKSGFLPLSKKSNKKSK